VLLPAARRDGGRLSRQAVISGGRRQVERWGNDELPPSMGGHQNETRGAVFYELIEIIFCYAELLEDLIKSQLPISLLP